VHPPSSLPLLVAWVATWLCGLTVASTAIGFALERFRGKPIFDVPLAHGQYRHELRGNAQFFVVAVPSIALALHGGWVRTGDESVLRFAATFAAIVVVFQAYYYALHRALHDRRLVRFHRWHHASHVTTPLSGQSMHAVEAVGWMVGYVGVPAALSLIAPLSLNGWLAYLAFNVVGNVVGHANAEVIAPSPFIRTRALGAAVFTYHALHHARWTGHYGFESAWCDRLFDTEWADWPTLHARVWSGAPLRSLKERGDPPTTAA
jgi:sterol desaturase/sphingolipid hydroxylase (fatty acid hydroxylase superfamily)